MTGVALLYDALRCPDDGGRLRKVGDALDCNRCGRRFSGPAPQVLELLPVNVRDRVDNVSEEYWSGYLAMRHAPLYLDDGASGWGSVAMPPEWVRLRKLYCDRVVSLVQSLIGKEPVVVVDASAGAGYVTRGLAAEGVATIHADLDPGSIVQAAHWMAAERSGIPLLAVRADYFSLPFERSAGVIIATDTLIRGVDHERVLLRSLGRAVSNAGFIIVDFHNWLHNPLRRLGLLPDNFRGNRSYQHAELAPLFAETGLELVDEVHYRQEEDQAGWKHLVAPVIPATRFLMVLRRTGTA